MLHVCLDFPEALNRLSLGWAKYTPSSSHLLGYFLSNVDLHLVSSPRSRFLTHWRIIALHVLVISGVYDCGLVDECHLENGLWWLGTNPLVFYLMLYSVYWFTSQFKWYCIINYMASLRKQYWHTATLM